MYFTGWIQTKSVKVNAQIYILVAELIKAINCYPDIRTIESCQGDGKKWACLSFTY